MSFVQNEWSSHLASVSSSISESKAQKVERTASQ